MEPEGLARLHHLAVTCHQRPSQFLGLQPTMPGLVYWCWAFDDLCDYCARYVEQVRRYEEWEEQTGYERVVAEGPNS